VALNLLMVKGAAVTVQSN